MSEPARNSIQFKVQHPHPVEFSAEGLTTEQMDRLVAFIVGQESLTIRMDPDALQVALPGTEPTESTEAALLNTAVDEIKDKSATEAPKTEPPMPAPVSHNRALLGTKPASQVVHSEHRSSISMEELVGDKLVQASEVATKSWGHTDPEFWRTGIKVDETPEGEVRRYKTTYWCPNKECNPDGKRYNKHYERIDALYTTCHNCQTKIAIYAATNKGRGTTEAHRDPVGNFLKAKFPYIEKEPRSYERNLDRNFAAAAQAD